jgi:NSS family neurotransmitter:Na+ symporter
MAWQTGTPLTDLAASGPGLAFVVFPEALSLMPMPWLFSILFFVMLLSLAIDSAFSLVEGLNAVILDTCKQWKLTQISFWVCLAGFGAGTIFTTRAGLYFLNIVDRFATNYNLMLVGVLQSILVGWVYGAEKVRRYMDRVSDWRVGKWWNVTVKYIIPAVLVGLMAAQFSQDLRTPYEGYPAWALGIGWAIAFVPFLLFLILLAKDLKRLEQISKLEGDDASQ